MVAVLKAVARYGSKAVNWVRAHSSQILHWLDIGQGVDWIVSKVKQALGIK